MPQVHEKNLPLTVTEAFYLAIFFNHTSLFVLIQNPKRNADVSGVEEVSGKDDDCFNEIVLDELTADFQLCAIVRECTVCKQEPSNTVLR